MTTKLQTMKHYLAEQGLLQTQWPGFQYRHEQLRMAETIDTAIQVQDSIAMEAPTGLGKTLAYLLPALLSDKKIIISVGNRTLQDHLWLGEYQKLKLLLSSNRDLSLLKGCENYLCLHRVKEGLSNGEALITANWQAINQWLQSTDTGDLDTFPIMSHSLNGVKQAITVTSQQCLGRRCPDLAHCYFQRARVSALEAKLLLINHSLLLSDNRLFEKGMLALLPSAEMVIVDEAHQLPDMLCRQNARTIDGQQFQWFLRRFRQFLLSSAPAYTQALLVIEQLQKLWRAVEQQIVARGQTAGLIGIAAQSLKPMVVLLIELRQQLHQVHLAVQNIESDIQRLDQWIQMLEPMVANEQVIYCDSNITGLRLLSPLLSKPFAGLQKQGVGWIFLSATLKVDKDIAYFRRMVSLPELRVESYGSAMDYENNALLWIPEHLPEPGHETFSQVWARLLLQVKQTLDGGLLALFSSHQALQSVADALPADLAERVLVYQPGSDRNGLLQQFRRDGNALLLATGSFWEGVDIKGSALRCVAIDKLPFAAPDDLIAQVWKTMATENRQHWFNEYVLPQAITRLRQGVGRLLRAEDDKGLVIIGDVRLLKRGYGPRVLNSLPAMRVVNHFDQVQEFLVQQGVSRYAMKPNST